MLIQRHVITSFSESEDPFQSEIRSSLRRYCWLLRFKF